MDILERVGSSRMMLDGKFPYPSAMDCMRYAVQEMAEYDDALMRQEQPDHKRNNSREHDPRKEAGQAGYMIVSAMLKVEGCKADCESQYMNKKCLYGAIVRELGDALSEEMINMYVVNGLDWALAYWKELCTLYGWDVPTLIEDTCADFERKHLEPVGPDMRHGGKTA